MLLFVKYGQSQKKRPHVGSPESELSLTQYPHQRREEGNGKETMEESRRKKVRWRKRRHTEGLRGASF